VCFCIVYTSQRALIIWVYEAESIKRITLLFWFCLFSSFPFLFISRDYLIPVCNWVAYFVRWFLWSASVWLFGSLSFSFSVLVIFALSLIIICKFTLRWSPIAAASNITNCINIRTYKLHKTYILLFYDITIDGSKTGTPDKFTILGERDLSHTHTPKEKIN